MRFKQRTIFHCSRIRYAALTQLKDADTVLLHNDGYITGYLPSPRYSFSCTDVGGGRRRRIRIFELGEGMGVRLESKEMVEYDRKAGGYGGQKVGRDGVRSEVGLHTYVDKRSESKEVR